MDKVSTNGLLLGLIYINPNIYSYTCIYMHAYMRKNTSAVFFLNIMYDLGIYTVRYGLPGGSDSKESLCKVGDLSSVSGSGRSPGEENGYSLQYSYLENSKDRGAWWATLHGLPRVRHD